MGQTAICLFGSLYLYAFGPYGFSTARTSIADPAELCSRTLHWVEDSISWLEDVFGAFTTWAPGSSNRNSLDFIL